MGMSFKEELDLYDTINGWTRDDLHKPYCVALKYKSIDGDTTPLDEIYIKIDDLLTYNNIDYISMEEIYETAQDIINYFKN